MNKFLIAVAVFLSTVTSAHAWGAREQGILAGIAGTLIYQHIQQGHPGVAHYPQPVYIPQQQPQIIVQPQPVYVPQQQPQVIIIQQRPHYNGHRHGHYNGGHFNNGYYQTPDPRVYNPQMQ
jgi:hypothetical protein